jgi:hypothetical protein
VFNLYIPPDVNEFGRFCVFKYLIYALDNEINRSKGMNHIIVAGDFNVDGMKEMEVIAKTRGLTRMATATRKGAELDAVWVSESVKIMSQEVGEGSSDHLWVRACLKFPTKEKEWIDYCITEEVGTGIIRSRLQNRENLELLKDYDLAKEPFAARAKLGDTKRKIYIKLGNKPPM